jgi:hypothetical protein
MTDNITELRPSPTKGEAPSRNALKQRRYRKRKAVSVSRSVTGSVTVPRVKPLLLPAPVPSPATSKIDVAAYVAAIGLASVAALFSIRGMVTLFPGAPVLIVAMASMMEASKLVAAGWLARRWRLTAWVWRLALVTLVAGLAVINAAGVYAQLVAAHVGERGEAAAAVETQDATLASRIDVQAHTVADLDRRLVQIDTVIEEAARRGKTTTALSAMESHRRARAGLVEERKREAGPPRDVRSRRNRPPSGMWLS